MSGLVGLSDEASVEPLSPGQGEAVQEGLHRGFAVAILALMGAFLIVVDQPATQIVLQGINRRVEGFTERRPIELIQHRLVQPLTDAVSLGVPGLGAGVLDVLHRQVEFIGMLLGVAAVFRAPVGQDP